MKCRLNGLVTLIAGASLVLGACSSDNGGGGGGDASTGGASGSGGSSATGGKTSTGGTTGSTGGTKSSGGTTGSSGGTTSSTGGTTTSTGGSGTGGKKSMPDAGGPDGNMFDASPGDAGNPALIARGDYLVNHVALCGGCHTDRSKPTALFGGNATFATGLPTPNLTSDATGLGSWSNTQIKNAFRNGVDKDGMPLSPVMPYQLFHNMSDADADAIVAYLRSLPHINNDVGMRTVTVTGAATPYDPATFPAAEHSNPDSGSTDFAEAEAGFYLVTSIAGCAKCHTPVNASKALNLSPTTTFTGGAPTMTATATTPMGYFAPNITPDATGIKGWTADDVATFLKTGVSKSAAKVCGSMPVGPTGGYGGLTDADAHAIGVYLTNLPPIANSAADLTMEPTCP
jgi:hypothetical protein